MMFKSLLLNPKINEMRTILLMCLTTLGILLPQSIIAQTKTVTGFVVDAGTNEKLPGVNVVIKNTTIGLSTDANGQYSISVSPGQVLVFTSVGYLPVEVTVGTQINQYKEKGYTLTQTPGW
jgi:TonB-dependent starch-binding outer membrane protein SusC